MKAIIISILILSISTFVGCNMQNNEKTNQSEGGSQLNGLQIRGRYIGKTTNEPNAMTVEIELKNISSENISIFDFQDRPARWSASASYFRGMLIGIKGRREPTPYHLLTGEIDKIIELAPGESYLFFQNDINSSLKDFQLIYDTSVVQEYWPGNYWKGRIETPTIYVEQK